jgi:pilus assembly protein CpaB
MAKPRAVIVAGVLAVVVAIIASIALYNYLKGQEERVKGAVATEKIVVAATEISTGTTIDTTKVKLVDWPKATVPQGSFTSQEQVVGRIAIDRYLPGEPILEAKLTPKEGVGGILSYKIPEGHRAITVAVDQVAGVAGFINPGNKVDVVLTITPTGSAQAISKIIPSLQNIPVLAIGQIVEQKEGKPVVVPTVTMDVTPSQAEELALASSHGRLQLVLRRAGDTAAVQTTGATITKVISGVTAPSKKPIIIAKAPKKETEKPAPVEVKPTPPPSPPLNIVEVIKGTSRTTEQFKQESNK